MIEQFKKNPRLHSPVRSKTRADVLKDYSTYEIKRDMSNEFNYMNVKEVYSKFYAGIDPRRRVEMADAGMAEEDKNAIANLSNTAYQKQYPSTEFKFKPYLDDGKKE